MSITRLCYCGARCEPGKHRCPKHQRKDTRPSAHARGYDARHRQDRAKLLRERPFCEECGAPATVLDHKDGMGPLGPFGHSEDNFEALCASCHGIKTAKQTPGGWNARPRT